MKANKSTSGLWYEVTSKPFWGPKQKAIIALGNSSCSPMSHEAYAQYLKDNYPSCFPFIQWIRFHDYYDSSFTKKKFSKKMRLAILNTKPDIKTRDILFQEREKITFDTGWYPLVMGNRCNFSKFKMKSIQQTSIKSIGAFKSFTPIANSSSDGISFELEGSQGKYLLDFGFNGTSEIYDAYFMTHTHSDHFGGIQSMISNIPNNSPIISSKTGASFLHYKLDSKYWGNIFHTGFNDKITFDDGASIEFIKVYHTQGAVGYKFTDPNGVSFYYFGDVCLKNGFADYRQKLFDYIQNSKTHKNIILFDGAMIGRKQSIDEDDTPQKILEEFSSNSEKRNLVFFSNQPENSIYSYLNVFKFTQKVPHLRGSKILVSTSILPLLTRLIEPIIFNFDDYKDPVFRALYGAHKSNPVESQRLYPLTDKILDELEDNEKVVIFAGIKDLKKISNLKSRFDKADVILAGTFALRNDLPKEFSTTRPRSIIRVASEDWSFHSNESDISDFIRKVDSRDTKIYLFHNYFGRLMNFIKNNQFNSRRIRALGDRYDTLTI